ncbi:MAG: YdiY family protein [Gammaproteobacteria bacterium]
MKNLYRIVGAALLCLAAAAAVAADVQGPWSGKVLLGYLATAGNSESTSANLEAGVDWDGARWHHSLSGRAIGQSQDNDTTAESYKATYGARFDLSERTFLLGLLDYNKNRFTTYDQQVFEFVGLGRRLIRTDRQELDAEAGVGASQSDLRDGRNQDEGNWRASARYSLNIGENASFLQALTVNSGSSNTFTESVTELRANIYGSLAMVLSYTVRNNTDVLPGTDKTDTFAAVNLEYAFGQ